MELKFIGDRSGILGTKGKLRANAPAYSTDAFLGQMNATDLAVERPKFKVKVE